MEPVGCPCAVVRMRVPILAAALLLLGACSQQETNTFDTRTWERRRPQPQASMAPPASATEPMADDSLGPDGLGTIRIGRPAPEGLTADKAPVSEGCRIVSDTARRIYAMTDGKVVTRVTAMTGSPVQTARGIATGASEAAVRIAYPDVTQEPHKYVAAPAKYLDWRATRRQDRIALRDRRARQGQRHSRRPRARDRVCRGMRLIVPEHAGAIRVGVGGWIYAPWRDNFYPKGLVQARELEYLGAHLTATEINATFYKLQKPESFAKWRDAVPDHFRFAVKGSGYCTNRKNLGEAGEGVSKFVRQGLVELGDKLGPINWQLKGTKRFDADEIAAFSGAAAVCPRRRAFATRDRGAARKLRRSGVLRSRTAGRRRRRGGPERKVRRDFAQDRRAVRLRATAALPGR